MGHYADMKIRSHHIALLMLAPVAVLFLTWHVLKRTPITNGSIYAFDTGTGKLFTTADAIPPMRAPSGVDAGVLAFAVRFDGDADPTVIYLTTYTSEVSDAIHRVGRNQVDVIAGTLVKRPTDTEWTPTNTPAGKAIRECTAEIAAGRTWRIAIPE